MGITGPKQSGDNRSRNGGDNVNLGGNNQSGSRGKQSIPITTNERTQESGNIALTDEHPHSARQSGAGSGDLEGEYQHSRDHVRGDDRSKRRIQKLVMRKKDDNRIQSDSGTMHIMVKYVSK